MRVYGTVSVSVFSSSRTGSRSTTALNVIHLHACMRTHTHTQPPHTVLRTSVSTHLSLKHTYTHVHCASASNIPAGRCSSVTIFTTDTHTATQRVSDVCVFAVDVFTLSVVQRHAVRDLHAVDFVAVVLLFGRCHDTAASSTLPEHCLWRSHTEPDNCFHLKFFFAKLIGRFLGFSASYGTLSLGV